MDQTETLSLFPFDRPDEGPPSEYDDFRKSGSLQRVRLPNGKTAWLATRYEDVRSLLADNRFSADSSKEGYPQLSAARPVNASTKGVRPINYMDPPEHTRFRRALSSEFSFSRMQSLQPMVDEIINDLLDKLLELDPPVDLIGQFALPVPTSVILKMLGISYGEHAFFQERANRIISMDLPREITMQAQEDIRGRLLEIFREKEANTEADDLMGRLVRQQVQTGNLSYEEACSLCQSLVIAGHETTANMIGLGTLSLLRNPGIFRRLRDDNSMMVVGLAVEEMLRYWTTVNYVGMRVAVEDVEFGGVTIKAGDGILPQVLAANHDPAVFNSPEKFDIDRQSTYPHVAFGFGIHQCIGQQLSRIELKSVFNCLTKRIPALRLAVPFEELEFKSGYLAHSLKALPLAW